jgi:hypothetical protein
VCVEITRDVMSYEKQGQPIAEIRRLVDVKWSKTGPGTNTPLPQ